ncbi:MAG: UvrB/UvrC motif-containing protein [Candidatus Delongbacteria bacterium]|jgi:protein-arginine kinase activator protein McsA|nr:UvrB/UvrC motif-containing protein [Candidatus Delongbacteria bacterium]
MKCDKCGAPNVVTKIVIQGPEGKDSEELNLCPTCFQKFIKDHPEIKNGQMGKSLNDFLLGTLNLVNSDLNKNSPDTKKVHEQMIKTCAKCGTTVDRLNKSNRVGCADCYDVFAEEIDNILFEEIGNNRKTLAFGKQSDEEKIIIFQEKLDYAIKDEDYELAALLRDELKKMA